MSVLNQSGEEQVECPLCMEPLEVDDLHFYPCTCGYQICRFCWNRIREGENGLCPACRKAYPENPADFTPLSQEQVAAIKTEKKAREQKRRNKTLESRRALANVRVVQNNLVFVVGLPVRLADPEILKRQEYFGKYGKIHKVVINQSTAYAGSQGPSASAYVTYVSGADALRAIQGVNNVALDGRVLKGSLGTTKYCANFMKNQPCPKPDCMYLHELGDPKASFTKEEMHAGLHQVYERKLHHQLLHAARPDDKHYNGSGNSSTNAEKSSSKDGNQSNFIPTTVVTSSHINVVNSNKSNKKDSSSGSASSSTSGKEAWPSLGSSPPSDSPARKQSSPKPHSTVKSQENGTSESSSPTQLQAPQNTAQTKGNKDTHTDSKPNRNKDTSTTNGQSNSKKSKSDKSKQKSSNNSINNDNSEAETEQKLVQYSNNNTNNSQTHSVFETEHTQSYLTSELDELESDRHSLLETHDLLDTSDHSLLEDDDTHHLLGDGRDTRPLASLRSLSGLASPYLPAPTTLPRESNHLLGANYHTNPNMLPPFGMRAENGLSAMPSGFLMHNQQQMHQANLVNGFDSPHTTSEGRYLSENMDKFFTDFNKAQQMRQMNHANDRYPHNNDPMHFPHNMLSAERLEMEHKQRMNNVRASEGVGRAAGDGDDDLDFDPFKETQKAFAELMENEMLQNGDNMERVRRSRLPPPGFSHVSGFGLQPRPHQHQGYVAHSADWSQLDPAIVSVGGKQQEVWARVQQLQQLQLQREGWQRLPWAPFVPLPPGFAPNKPPQHPAECIDAK